MYFVVLSIAFGVWMIIAGPVVHLLRKKWAWLRAKKMYPEKRPLRVWASAMIRTLIVGLTWGMQMRHRTWFSLAVTVAVSLMLVRTSQLVFNYQRYRQLALAAAEKRPTSLLVLKISMGVLGAGMIVLGIVQVV